MQTLTTKAHLRWMIRRDLDAVVAIEDASFEYAWTAEDFADALRQSNVIGVIAEFGDEVVGYVVYELHKDELRILNLAVAPNRRRLGVGTQLVQRMIAKLHEARRDRLALRVRERNLPAQMFLRSLGFIAEEVISGYYEDNDEDAYQFSWSVYNPIWDPLREDVEG